LGLGVGFCHIVLLLLLLLLLLWRLWRLALTMVLLLELW
jgi:hypothetical protein